MPTPNAHAKLSASSAHRWLNCTAAPGFEEQFPRTSSTFAEEGTLAHEFCEIYGRLHFDLIDSTDAEEACRGLKTHELYNPEMEETAEFYAEQLWSASLGYESKPAVFFEVRVNLGEYIPDGFGTCDCCMVGGDTLHIFDYKHGKGVEVSAEGNPQMRLYALGALAKFRPIYGDAIKRVVTSIIQPRITREPSTEEITVEELLAWGEATVKPKAYAAYTGSGAEFHAGDWCRFCAGKAQCRARAAGYTALEEFAAMDTKDPKLSDDEIADLLRRGSGIVKWYEELQDYARSAILAGRALDGWKVVAGRSSRKFTDVDEALATIKAAGYDEAILYERKPLTLAELEKLIGKKKFAELCGAYITKPAGNPTLVEASDKRPPYNTAAIEAEGLK